VLIHPTFLQIRTRSQNVVSHESENRYVIGGYGPRWRNW
jgi:hypothetical protein